jgi:hypothetical protein
VTALNMEARDNAVQVHIDKGTVNIGAVLTVTEIRQIALYAAKTVLLESWPIAEKLIAQRAEQITDQVIAKIGAKNPNLFNRFEDPRFLAPLVSVQRSFAETGDAELGGILSGLLSDLAAEPIRTRREIVLRESMECAPKLTTRHLNALSVIFRITRIVHPLALDPSRLVSLLDSELRPYFDAVPSDSFDYSYMGATQAGTFVPAIGGTIYDRIYASHRNAMYEPFDVDELPKVYAGPIDQIQSEMNEVVHMIEIPYELTEAAGMNPTKKIKLKTDRVNKILSPSPTGLTAAETKFREFLRRRSINEPQFTALIRDESPELAQFLDRVASTGALSFQLSPVGMMLARHEIETRSPEMAAQLDALFDD